MNLVTLTHDELRKAATVLDANLAEGMTSVASLAHAMRAVNVMRTPAANPDCADCRRFDGTCPGHLPTRKAAK
ncbi:hypothetical protein SEA_CHRIS_51 [Mycobacterium phage Chris]|uniref:Uncharacterized protein n=1 Tax=Mycobacterium phage Chris TaxID=2725626 RepID=A0A6M3SWS9_9CAUD|nr:hypothetical protein I5G96_gp054 [Mycobacterium phage Chris]QJD50453.1 hypothetical protein SEA_CHRIS_51 [Mycobacterium phage Chris]